MWCYLLDLYSRSRCDAFVFFSGHIECVKWLVANRSSLSVKDDMGRTPREIAEEFHQEDVVKFLKACEEELDNPSSGFAQLRNTAGYGNKEEY